MDLIFVPCKAVQRSSFHFPRSHDDDPLTHFWDYFNIFSYTVHVRQIEMMPDGLAIPWRLWITVDVCACGTRIRNCY